MAELLVEYLGEESQPLLRLGLVPFAVPGAREVLGADRTRPQALLVDCHTILWSAGHDRVYTNGGASSGPSSAGARWRLFQQQPRSAKMPPMQIQLDPRDARRLEVVSARDFSLPRLRSGTVS